MPTERKEYNGPSTSEGKSVVDSPTRPEWFTEHVESIPDPGRRLLEEYSGIAPEQVLPHVISIRDKAFDIWDYACIGQVRFLDFTLPKLPYWSQVLPRLRSGATFVDAGCCFGQEIRFLVFKEGVPATQLYGFDLQPAFIDMGYELFRDRGKLHANMFSGDILADPSAPEGQNLTALEGKMDIVPAASLLHFWGWDDMIAATKRLVSLTRKQSGSMIIGKQMGTLDAGEYAMPTGGVNYRHNVESMERFWRQVGEESASSWKVESGLVAPPAGMQNMKQSWAAGSDTNMRMLWFCATRT